MPRLKRVLGPDGDVAAGTLGTVLAMGLFVIAQHPAVALIACIIAGTAWIAVRR